MPELPPSQALMEEENHTPPTAPLPLTPSMVLGPSLAPSEDLTIATVA